MDGRSRAGEVVDLVDLDKEGMRHVVPHRLEQRCRQKIRDVVLAAGEVVVDAEHVMALRDQALTQMRAEKAGAAGDENALGYGAHAGFLRDCRLSWCWRISG